MKAPNKITFQTFIKNGKWTKNTKLISDFNEVHNESYIEITLHKKRNKRSNPQNKYYWGVIVSITRNCISEQWGELMDISAVHDLLKNNCNYEEKYNEETGQVIRTVISTTENDTVQQEEYHTRCRTLVYDFFDVEIPLPNPDKESDEIDLNFNR